jgi:hypothetical protein
MLTGDTCSIENGTYTEFIADVTTVSGVVFCSTCKAPPSGVDSSTRTKIKATNRRLVIVRPPAVPGNSPAIGMVTFRNASTPTSHVEISGIIFDSSVCHSVVGTTAKECDGMQLYTGIDRYIFDNEIKGAMTPINKEQNGIHLSGINGTGDCNGSTANIISTNYIHNLGNGDGAATSLGHGVYISTSGNTVASNDIQNIAGACIQTYASTVTTCRNPQNNMVARNKCTNNAMFGSTGDSAINANGDNNMYYANDLYNVRKNGFYASLNTPTGNKFYNNTICNVIVQNGSRGFHIATSGASGNIVQNNVVFQATTAIENIGSGTSCATNYFNGVTSSCATVSPSGDPLFVASACANRHLASGSPLIDAGTNLTADVATDLDGTVYGVPMNIGAYMDAVVSPLHLAFLAPPATAVEGVTMAVVTAEILDAVDVRQTSHPNDCVIAKQSGPGTLSGTLNVAPSSGVCTWSTLSLDTDGTYTLVATSPGSPTVTQVISGNVIITNAGAAGASVKLNVVR